MQFHVTNGEAFNLWFVRQTGMLSVPFNEAMLTHGVKGKPFSDEFMLHRAEIHQVSHSEYRQKMIPFLDAVCRLNQDDELVLWFGTDAFCQMNLLTIFEYLIQKRCQAKVSAVLFDENQPWELSLLAERKEVNPNDYQGLYDTVLLRHQKVMCHDAIMNQAIELFLDLRLNEGRVMTLILNSLHLDEDELMKLILNETEKEGLSDVQVHQMIKRARRISVKINS